MAPPLIAALLLPVVGTGAIGGLCVVLAALLSAQAGVDLDEAAPRLLAVALAAGLAVTIAVFRGRAERAVARYASARARTAALMDASLDATITMDAAGRILDWNPAAERTFGHSREDAVGRELAGLILPQDMRARHRAGLAHYRETGEARVIGRRLEMKALRSDGAEIPVELTVTRVESAGPVVFAGAVRDITARLEMEQRLAHQAFHDPLTGLPNRKLLLDRLENALRRAKRSGAHTALLFLDLDGFKGVNDGHGHQAGDRVLEATAARLSGAMRPSDTVARFGGDEFALVAEEVSPEAALGIAARVREAVDLPVSFEGETVSVSASIGITFSEAGAGTADLMLSEADAAMYRAKQRGRGRIVVFSDELRPHAAEDRTLESELRRALERDELIVLYQPVVDVEARRVVGAEALVRWDHPDRGRLAPGQFLPLAEDTGLIEPVGELVLREACHHAERWSRADGGGFGIAVNCSPVQVRDTDLPAAVAAALETSGLEPARLWLEITERALVGSSAAQGVLKSISRLGVRVAIDDFGTGYSSLAQLRQLPVAAVKVDREFVEGVDRSSDDSAIITAVTEMAHALDMEVVAEGVEREGQVGALRRCGCDRAQGFLFGRPGGPERVDELLTASRG